MRTLVSIARQAEKVFDFAHHFEWLMQVGGGGKGGGRRGLTCSFGRGMWVFVEVGIGCSTCACRWRFGGWCDPLVLV